MEEWPRRHQYRIARPLPVSIFVLHIDVTKNKGRKGESGLAMRDYQMLGQFKVWNTYVAILRAYLNYAYGHTSAMAVGILQLRLWAYYVNSFTTYTIHILDPDMPVLMASF